MDHRLSSPTDFGINLLAEACLPLSYNAQNHDHSINHDSVSWSNEQECYSKPNYSFSWKVQPPFSTSYAESVDDLLDNNTESSNYCNLQSSYKYESTPQEDFYAKTVQAAESLPSSSIEVSKEQPAELLEEPSTPPPLIGLIPEQILATSATVSSISTQEWYEQSPELVEESSLVQQSPELTLATSNTDKSSTSIPSLPSKGRHCGRTYQSIGGEYACPSCDRSFTRRHGLTQHIDAHHSGSKDERCVICGKRFRLRQELEKHLPIHQEHNKPLACEYCPKKYVHRTDLARHQKFVHSGDPIRCRSCGKSFLRLHHMREHELKHKND